MKKKLKAQQYICTILNGVHGVPNVMLALLDKAELVCFLFVFDSLQFRFGSIWGTKHMDPDPTLDHSRMSMVEEELSGQQITALKMRVGSVQDSLYIQTSHVSIIDLSSMNI